jgi:DNA-binding transcriptional MerR regulator
MSTAAEITLGIGEVSALSGLTTHTLRFHEKVSSLAACRTADDDAARRD